MSEPASAPVELGNDHGYGPDIDHVLLSEEQIQNKITELADQVADDYAGREVLLVGVLKGAVLFMSDFARALRLPTRMEFMAVSSYGSSTSSSGVVRSLTALRAPRGDRRRDGQPDACRAATSACQTPAARPYRRVGPPGPAPATG